MTEVRENIEGTFPIKETVFLTKMSIIFIRYHIAAFRIRTPQLDIFAIIGSDLCNTSIKGKNIFKVIKVILYAIDLNIIYINFDHN
jgi:hypothetical protein